MKNCKGITLTSLMIYVIGMTSMIAIVATITTFFYRNVNVDTLNSDTTTQYTKFLSSFSKEVNKKGNKVVECKTNSLAEGAESYIVFSNGIQFTFLESNKSIYRNQVKICENIDKCIFSSEFAEPNYKVSIEFKSGDVDRTASNAINFTIKGSL